MHGARHAHRRSSSLDLRTRVMAHQSWIILWDNVDGSTALVRLVNQMLRVTNSDHAMSGCRTPTEKMSGCNHMTVCS
jgi:hypothetical protein